MTDREKLDALVEKNIRSNKEWIYANYENAPQCRSYYRRAACWMLGALELADELGIITIFEHNDIMNHWRTEIKEVMPE